MILLSYSRFQRREMQRVGSVRLADPRRPEGVCQLMTCDRPAAYLWTWVHRLENGQSAYVELPICTEDCATMRSLRQPTEYTVRSLEATDA